MDQKPEIRLGIIHYINHPHFISIKEDQNTYTVTMLAYYNSINGCYNNLTGGVVPDKYYQVSFLKHDL